MIVIGSEYAISVYAWQLKSMKNHQYTQYSYSLMLWIFFGESTVDISKFDSISAEL